VLAILLEAECLLPDSVSDFQFPGRKITFPIALDDQWSRDALQRYMRTTRDRAIYLPSNIDYLARNNGLDGGPAEALQKLTDSPWVCISHDRCVLTLKSNEACLWRRILSRMSILGSCKAVTTESIWLLTVEQIDPRCRLVGQKMNPSRTYTPSVSSTKFSVVMMMYYILAGGCRYRWTRGGYLSCCLTRRIPTIWAHTSSMANLG
jgi:urea carboxylase